MPSFPKNEHFLPPDTHTYVCVSGVRNVCFSENLAGSAFLLPLFWDSPFCLFNNAKWILTYSPSCSLFETFANPTLVLWLHSNLTKVQNKLSSNLWRNFSIWVEVFPVQVLLRHMPKDTQLLSMLTLSFVTNVHSLQLYSTETKQEDSVNTSGNTRYYALTEQKEKMLHTIHWKKNLLILIFLLRSNLVLPA